MEWMVTTNGNALPTAAEESGSGTFFHEQASPRADDEGVGTTTVMVLPPSSFYPVPNDVKGDLIGDGSPRVVWERVRQCLSKESLAAHLWGKSWQSGARPKGSSERLGSLC